MALCQFYTFMAVILYLQFVLDESWIFNSYLQYQDKCPQEKS